MLTAIILLAFCYLAGAYLLIRSFRKQPKWFEDEHGQLHPHP
ncbi:hypothetical protein OH491_05425 [Termitidicoccus mucosus]